jgi:hypothetical protein
MCSHFCSAPYSSLVPSISFSLIWSSEYLFSGATHTGPHHAFFPVFLVTCFPLCSNVFLNILFSKPLSLSFFPSVGETKLHIHILRTETCATTKFQLKPPTIFRLKFHFIAQDCPTSTHRRATHHPRAALVYTSIER